MSAKWRRYKKRSKRFHVSGDSDRAKDKKDDQPFRIENLRVRRRTYHYKHSLSGTYRGRKWKEPEPLIDVLEKKDKIIVVAEFAGFKRENLRIHIKDQRLTLSAKASDRKYHKSLNLPQRVLPSTVCTSYKNGVLEIELRKVHKEKSIDKVVS